LAVAIRNQRQLNDELESLRKRRGQGQSEIDLSLVSTASVATTFRATGLEESLAHLKPRDHLCLLYENQIEWKTVAIPFIRIGLERGQAVVYGLGSHPAKLVRSQLVEAGVDVGRAESSGQLRIFSPSEIVRSGRGVGFEAIVRHAATAVERALVQGYPVVRVAFELDRARPSQFDLDHFLEHEDAVEREITNRYPSIALCQYGRRSFEPEIIKAAVVTHSLLVRRGQVICNPYHLPSSEALTAGLAERELEIWLDNIEREGQERMRADFLADLLLRTSQPLSVSDANRRLLSCNPAFGQLTGYKEEELINLSWQTDLTPAEWRSVGDRAVEELARTGKPQRYEKEILCKDGSRRPIEVLLQQVTHEDGSCRYLYSFVTDITERKRAEEALRANEAKYRELANSLPQLIYEADTQGNITFYSENAFDFFGLPRDASLAPGTVFERLVPEDRARAKRIIARKLRGEHNGSTEYAALRADGSTFPILLSSSPIYRGDEVVGLRGIITDITEQKQAQEALRRSEKQFRLLAEHARDAVYRCELRPTRRFEYVSPAIFDIVGYRPAEFYADPDLPFKLIHPEDQPLANATLKGFGGSGASVVLRMIHRDGRTVWTEQRITLLRNSDGEPVAMEGLTQDITERIRVDQALRESEERYRRIVDAADEGIFVVDEEGSTTFVNRKMAEMVGESADQILNTSAAAYSDEETRSTVLAAFERLKQGRKEQFEVKIRRSDGEPLWAIVTASPILDEQGHYTGALGMVTDITERKRAEDTLSRQERLLQAILDNLPARVVLKDGTGALVAVNQKYCTDIGISQEEAIGKTAANIFSASQAEKYLSSDAEVYGTGRTVSFLEEGASADGSQCYLETHKVPLKNDDGAVEGLLAFSFDITERRRTELALRESEERYRQIIETAEEGVIVVDLDFKTVFANDKMAEMLGYDLGDLLRSHFADLSGEEGLKVITQGRERWRQGIREQFDFKFRRRDGSALWSIVRVAPIFEKDGSFGGVLAMVTDITERKRAEEDVKETLEKLRTTLEGTVKALAATAEMRDPYTAGHQQRVAELATAIAEEMGLPAEQVEGIRVAATLHDLGKIYVPAEILNKPGKITDVETSIIRVHPEVGHEILSAIDFPWPVASIVLQHHERLDGSGYPLGLSDGDILLESRILAVADVAEAMASHRPYRPALGIDRALEEINQNSGRLYDTSVVEACLKVFARSRVWT
jgi:PAS domain S-box-containing protein/putative nucleotidyltransferase with HDIG domain